MLSNKCFPFFLMGNKNPKTHLIPSTGPAGFLKRARNLARCMTFVLLYYYARSQCLADVFRCFKWQFESTRHMGKVYVQRLFHPKTITGKVTKNGC